MVGDKSVMVILDGDHRRVQVKWELYKYRHITTPGQYMVAEDCYIDRGAYGPKEAVDWFLDRHKGWEYVDESMKYLVGITMGGWLLKK
jgi:cephalosporin hydroxylase